MRIFSKPHLLLIAAVFYVAPCGPCRAASAPAPTKAVAKVEEKIEKSSNVADISLLGQRKTRIKELVVADETRDTSFFIIKYKDDSTVHVVRVPSYVSYEVQLRILIPNAIPYTIAGLTYIKEHKNYFASEADAEPDSPEPSAMAQTMSYLQRHIFDIGFFVLMAWMVVATLRMSSFGSSHRLIKPGKLKGDLDDLVGMEDIKQEILQLEGMIRGRDAYEKHNLNEPFNVMLTGPAGTGKTKIVGYLAKRLGLPLIEIAASSLESGFVGGGSRTLHRMYRQACAKKKCIIFLDEAQSLFMPRGRSSEKWTDDTANTLLSLLDGVNSKTGRDVIWIVASNFDDATSQMDEAMLRRFGVKINFRLPNQAERREILQRLICEKQPEVVDWKNIDLDAISSATSNLSPAALATLIDQTSLIAIREQTSISTALLLRAFERTTIGLTDRATSANKHQQRERVAIHELGHFFAQFHPIRLSSSSIEEAKQKSRVLKISTESVSKIGALGYVLHSEEDIQLRSLDELEHEIVVLYSGLAAEELHYGAKGISMGAQNDIEKATRALTSMICRVSSYSDAKLDYSQIEQPAAAAQTLRDMELKSAELYSQAKKIVAEYMPIINDLKDVLLNEYVLTKDEIFNWLSKYPCLNLPTVSDRSKVVAAAT
jgi:cell division protease FtsH